MRGKFFIILVSMNALICYSLVIADVTHYISKPRERFDVTYYQLNLLISPVEKMISGSVIMRAKSTIEGLNEITLNLYNTMNISKITGNILNFTHKNDLINIMLDHSYDIKESFEIEIFYSGKPEQVELGNSAEFTPFRFANDGDHEIICSDSCPYYARAWWPCKDTPSDKADSVHFFITVPENLDVAANGKFKGAIDNGDSTRTYHWHIMNPISTYLIAIQIADYVKLSDYYVSASGDSMEVSFFVFPEDCSKVLNQFKKIGEMIAVLSDYYGEYPYLNEKYAMVETQGNWAAVEYQTLSCFNRDYIANEMIALHELAHQWFGDCVTPKDFRHSWISEGFAVYSEALYVEHHQGREKYHDYMNKRVNALSYKERLFRDDVSSPHSIYHSVVYKKGAWVLHMLRHILGDSNFFNALREFRYRFEYACATTEDFQAVCEYISETDLDYFFEEWIYDRWHPEYECDWRSQPLGKNSFRVFVTIEQTQAIGPIFKMPLDITVETAVGDTTFIQFVDEKRKAFDFAVKSEPRKVIIDENGWILKEVSQIK